MVGKDVRLRQIIEDWMPCKSSDVDIPCDSLLSVDFKFKDGKHLVEPDYKSNMSIHRYGFEYQINISFKVDELYPKQVQMLLYKIDKTIKHYF